jgi:hypothetical protein
MNQPKPIFSFIVPFALILGFFLPWIASFVGNLSAFDFILYTYKDYFNDVSENDVSDLVLILLIFPISGLIVLISNLSRNPNLNARTIFSVLPVITLIIFFIWLDSEKSGVFYWDFEDFSLKGIGLGLWLTLIGSILLPFGLKKTNQPPIGNAPEATGQTAQVSKPIVSAPQEPILTKLPEKYYTRTTVIASAVIIFLYVIKLNPWQHSSHNYFTNLGSLYFILIPLACVYIILCPLFINKKWGRGENFAKHFVFWGLAGSFIFGWLGNGLIRHIMALFSAHGLAIAVAAFLPYEKRLVPLVMSQFKKTTRKLLETVQDENNTVQNDNNKEEKPVAPKVDKNKRHCIQCGALVKPEDTFCQQCGGKI